MALFALQEWLPSFASHMKTYDGTGLAIMALVHLGPTEFLYYWLHRGVHQSPMLSQYHALHHASIVTEPITGETMPLILLWVLFMLSSSEHHM